MIEKKQNRKLPDGWKWVKLCDLLNSLETGSRPKGGATGILEGIPSISAEHMTSYGAFDFSNLRFVPEDFYKEMVRGHITKDDILVVKDGATTGKVCFINDDFPFEKAVVNEHVFLCRPNKSVVVPYYLFFWLWSLDGQTEIRVNFQGAAIGGINQKFVNSVLIPLPPLEEQKRIAGILTEQTAVVEKARKACEEKLHVAQQLPDSYLYAVFNSPESKKWTVKRIEEICEITARQVDPKIPEYGNLPHVNGENIESGTRRLTFLKTAKELGMISGKYLFEKGDVLYSKLRPYLRKVFVADFKGVCSADMYPIRINKAIADPSFFAWLLLSNDFTKYANEESMRARMPKLNRKQLFAWKAKLPSLKEQIRLVEILEKQASRVETLCKTIESELETINKLPASLLQQAFEGKL